MSRLLLGTLVLIAALLIGIQRHLAAANQGGVDARQAPRYTPSYSRVAAFARDSVPSDVAVALPERVQWGETLSELLTKVGLSPVEAERAARVAGQHLDLRRIRAGERYATRVSRSGDVLGFSLEIEGRGRLELHRDLGAWSGQWEEFERTVAVRQTRGVLRDSLEASLRAAGAPGLLAYRMADVLQWDLDFNRDLRLGDHFNLIYEEVLLDGEFFQVGEILALHYENRGELLEAYRFGERGHYDGEGRPLRKLFLRSPLRYSRVTSRFSQRRFHPVLKTYRPHYGIDYGAPVGTPVRATASGVVDSVGWTKGGGKTIRIRHPNKYATSYLHLSRYAKGIRSGRRVSQGDVVGYVGSTGLSTGPHLDYRVQYRGRWINPAQLRSEPAPPIPDSERELFLGERDALRRRLEPAAAGVLAGGR